MFVSVSRMYSQLEFVKNFNLKFTDKPIQYLEHLLPSLNTIWLRKEWDSLPLNPNPLNCYICITYPFEDNIDVKTLDEVLTDVCKEIEVYSKTPNDIEKLTIKKERFNMNSNIQHLRIDILMKGII